MMVRIISAALVIVSIVGFAAPVRADSGIYQPKSIRHSADSGIYQPKSIRHTASIKWVPESVQNIG